MNYTYSKNLTDAVGTSQTYFEPLLDNDRPELELTRADIDTTHVSTSTASTSFRSGKGKSS